MKTILAINEEEYIIGKNSGKMVSMFFPEDCRQNCTFCTTKHLYKDINKTKFKKTLLKIAKSDIEEVIFTGGEPLLNISLLKEYLEIVKNKTVYINTYFLDNIDKAIEIFNIYNNIKGINISRHSLDTINIDKILQIDKPIRINIVNYKISDIYKYVNLWKNYKNIELTFREDYRTVNANNIYDFQTDTLIYLTTNYDLYSQVYCHVCNKYMFKLKNGFVIRYHRGLPNTRIKIGVLTEIQEFVVFPNGKLCTDWDGTTNGLKEISKILKL